MITYCKENLQELKQLIKSISNEQYSCSCSLLNGASIGQHIRHILEFYICLLNGEKSGRVNYDQRKRDLKLETDSSFSIYTIDKICSNLRISNYEEEILLEGNFSSNEAESITIKTTFKRELAYCLEHSIHHQALLKVALIELNSEDLITEDFGVAPATIRYKEQCAQ